MKQVYRRHSTILLGDRGLRIQLSIYSVLKRKERRAYLLRMFKELKSTFQELTLYEIRHEDDPDGTLLGLDYRGTQGVDALEVRSKDQEFGFQLRLFRARQGWTQKQLAEKLSVCHTYLSKIERGERSAPEIVHQYLKQFQFETTTARKLSSN